MSLIQLNLIDRGHDLISTAVSTHDEKMASRLVAKIYDSEHVQVTMLQEVIRERTYYIDLLDENIALTACRLFQ